ncbi:MAG: PLP-dependent aminotransferase family protein [Rhodoferax sp.]|nr:PLP-dependent aminotransferase family protein [Rhodoferax sp.]
MWKELFSQHPIHEPTLQGRLRSMIVKAILDGVISPGTVLPGSREMSHLLQVSRNTVSLAYQHLADQQYLQARARSGYVVQASAALQPSPAQASKPTASTVEWQSRFRKLLSELSNISKPANWQDYPFPFIHGQFDSSLFPAREWRECAMQALRASAVRDWASDRIDQDDEQLIEQIQQRVLPSRGIWVSKEEILVTAGAQQANYILADILFDAHTVLGLEEPGYPDVRNIYSSHGAVIHPIQVNGQGLDIDSDLSHCDYVYVTPSHQCPTAVTMPEARRLKLVEAAASNDFVIIEDDYDSDLNFDSRPAPALKSLDNSGRVIYVGSLSKTIAPGLRAGYMVADPVLIREARSARRLMMRHPPMNNERTLALFLSLGHYDMLLRRLTKTYSHRIHCLAEALQRVLPEWRFTRPQGGASLWVQGPEHFSMTDLAKTALQQGVIIEPGHIFFNHPQSSFAARHARLGVASIHESKIDAGIRQLAQVIQHCKQSGQ